MLNGFCDIVVSILLSVPCHIDAFGQVVGKRHHSHEGETLFQVGFLSLLLLKRILF